MHYETMDRDKSNHYRANLLTLLPADLYGVRRTGRFIPGGRELATAWVQRIGNEEYSLRSLSHEIDLSASWYHRLAAIVCGERQMQEHHLLALWEGLSGQREDGSLAMSGLGEESVRARLRVARLAGWYGQTRSMAEQIGYERTYLQKQLDHDCPLDGKLAFAVLNIGIRYEWFKEGKGPMYRGGSI